jgi:hypothetical protein
MPTGHYAALLHAEKRVSSPRHEFTAQSQKGTVATERRVHLTHRCPRACFGNTPCRLTRSSFRRTRQHFARRR